MRNILFKRKLFCKCLLVVILLSAVSLNTGCGGGGLTANNNNFSPTISNDFNVKSFTLGSDYPAGVFVPNISGMTTTAFVISVDSPVGLLAIELSTDPLQISNKFVGCTLPAGTGYPTGGAVFVSSSRAIILTSSHLVDCNPTTGEIRATLTLDRTVSFAQPMPLSRPFDTNGDGIAEDSVSSVDLSFPNQLAIRGDDLFVSFANYLQPIGTPVAAPGVVARYKILNQAPYLQTEIDDIVTTNFNPSGMLVYANTHLLIVNSGVNTITGGATEPVTNSGLDIVNISTKSRTFVDMGASSLSFSPPTIDSGNVLYLQSAAFNEVYSINIATLSILNNHDNPLILGNMSQDFMVQSVYDPTTNHLFTSSFGQSAIFPISTISPRTVQSAIELGFEAGVTDDNPSGTNTGVSGIALQPNGNSTHRLVAVTAFPGQLLAIDLEESNFPKFSNSNVQSNNTGDSNGAPNELPIFGEPALPPPLPEPPTATPPPGSIAEACTNPYATSVVNFTPGIGAGFGSNYYPSNVFGAPAGGSKYSPNNKEKDLLSLGCGGTITLKLGACDIVDGEGVDFIVFENAFVYAGNQIYSEPGRVSVSEDGINFYDFPCTYNESTNHPGCAGTQPSLGNPKNGVDPTDPSTAGGNGFDLSDLGIARARFIRIEDISCNNGLAPDAGFELDAVSVVWGEKI